MTRSILYLLLIVPALASCAGTLSPRATSARTMLDELTPPSPSWENEFDPSLFEADELRRSRPAPATAEYRIGPGDELRIHVTGHSELTSDFHVGPDGRVGFPLLGTVELQALTRGEASSRIAEALRPYLATPPVVAVDVKSYVNNRVYVLGRVENPGQVELIGSGTLLQAVAEAGGLPVREFRAFLSRAAIIRGSDEILWIDLIDLLQNGNVALNVPLQNGDVVFIPDSADATVFVMGEVESPGAVAIRARIRMTQALSKAGGPTEDADLGSVYLLRPPKPGKKSEPIRPVHIDLASMLETGDFTENVVLQSGDILYVARSGMGDVNYVLRKLVPGLALATAGALLLD